MASPISPGQLGNVDATRELAVGRVGEAMKQASSVSWILDKNAQSQAICGNRFHSLEEAEDF